MPHRMKAIVLTYDNNHFLADHMIATYNQLWPDHPFRFHIPYQDDPDYLKGRYGDLVKMVQAPKSIIGTVKKLVEGIDPNEWVYWAIDDKYLVELDPQKAWRYHEWIARNSNPSVVGLVTHRAWALWTTNIAKPLFPVKINDEVLLKRKRWENFWLHQYYRARAIQDMIATFPRDPIFPKEMDKWVQKKVENNLSLYVVEKPSSLFGESTTNGILNVGSLRSLQEHGIKIPKGRVEKFINREIIFGHQNYENKIFNPSIGRPTQSVVDTKRGELRIHIGAHRTGTTHLQDTLNILSPVLEGLGISYLPRHIMRRKGDFSHKINTHLKLPVKLISEENILGRCLDAMSIRPYPCSETRLTFLNDLSRHFELTIFLSIRSFDRLFSGAYATGLMFRPNVAVSKRNELLSQISKNNFPSWIEVIERLKSLLPGVSFRIWRQEYYEKNAAYIISNFSKCPIDSIPVISNPVSTMTPSFFAISEIERKLDLTLEDAQYWCALVRDIQINNLPKTSSDRFSLFAPEIANRIQAMYVDDVFKIKQKWPGDLIELS